MKRGAELFEPESIKAVIASQTWTNSTKALMIAAYKKFTVLNDIYWRAPKYEVVRKLPFIPLEREIDELVACCGKKMSVILQTLKETGMRIGEALRLEWTDVDFERRVIVLNKPEKHGNPRAFKISEKLVAMLYRLPQDDKHVFGGQSWRITFNNFNAQRKNAAKKLANPRILRIHFHTLRHWKATMEYHRTKDILYVMRLLGHKNIANTLIYTQLIEFENDEFHSAIAETIEAARKLIETGFEFVCRHEDTMLFRKRK